jgi:hypothetical protein
LLLWPASSLRPACRAGNNIERMNTILLAALVGRNSCIATSVINRVDITSSCYPLLLLITYTECLIQQYQMLPWSGQESRVCKHVKAVVQQLVYTYRNNACQIVPEARQTYGLYRLAFYSCDLSSCCFSTLSHMPLLTKCLVCISIGCTI